MFICLGLPLDNSTNNHFDCCPKAIKGILSCTKSSALKGGGVAGLTSRSMLSTQTQVSSFL